MKTTFNFFCIATLLFTSVMSAQDIVGPAKTSTAQQVQHMLSSKSVSSYQNMSPANSVYVQQIGNNNIINSDVHSNYSAVNILQYGNKNNIDMGVKAEVINENVMQLGDHHTFIDDNLGGAALHNANVTQQGLNQTLLISGSNSMSENLVVNMRGANQTVLIRNIKR